MERILHCVKAGQIGSEFDRHLSHLILAQEECRQAVKKDALGCMRDAAVPREFVLSGLADTGTNGTYAQATVAVHDMPAYQLKGGKACWLCYAPGKKHWVLQAQQHLGSSNGRAHTVPGEHVAPWDTNGAWKERVNGSWTSPEVRVLPQVTP